MLARFWGTRGLLATPGESFQRYGGATVCIELLAESGSRLVVDLGTGCVGLGNILMAEAAKGGSKRLAVMLSSTRIDHIHGLPFFAPALVPGWDLTIMGPSQAGRDLSGILDGSLNPNYSPLMGVANLTPKLELITLTEGEMSWDGFRIVTRELPHGRVKSLGFRIEADGATIACITDVEYEDLEPTASAIDLASEADVLIHDSMETIAEVVKRRGLPTSMPIDALRLARESGVKKLVLYHHDPDRDDASVDALLSRLRLDAPAGLEIDGARVGEAIAIGRKPLAASR